MKLNVNGKDYEHRGDGTVAALIAEVGATPEHTALTVNGRVIPSADWKQTKLNDGDAIEILTFVGGG
jgi:sulfur carrier protein